MIDFTEIPQDGEQWELFSRDFLAKLNFYVESAPDRGADRGKDMLVSEQVSGKIHTYRFSWLVSCKHFAQSGKSVNETEHERNILERVRSFKADGFIGFYSTIPSSGLNDRLRQLRESGDIKDYKFFDARSIENHLVTSGFSDLMMRYLPESYRRVKPLHHVTDDYEPMLCDSCGKDLLLSLFTESYKGIIVHASKWDQQRKVQRIEEIYYACKGNCDRQLAAIARAKGLTTSWLDISDLTIPVEYLRKVFAIMNRLRDGVDEYSDAAFDKQKDALIILGQKTLRFTTESELERLARLLNMPAF